MNLEPAANEKNEQKYQGPEAKEQNKQMSQEPATCNSVARIYSSQVAALERRETINYETDENKSLIQITVENNIITIIIDTVFVYGPNKDYQRSVSLFLLSLM